MSETVYLCSTVANGSRVYHTERDCKAIKNLPDDDIMAKQRDIVEPMVDMCSICAGTVEQNPGQTDYYQAALNYGENDD